ncbi:hypothetical protein NSS71_15310 [Niallia sp. FSL W8-0951]|uniref:hypothetical protein n=1 Tax=Niallia sp. FSL W8-0951 TaxID=2954639 RepID=UPI0030F6BBEC
MFKQKSKSNPIISINREITLFYKNYSDKFNYIYLLYQNIFLLMVIGIDGVLIEVEVKEIIWVIRIVSYPIYKNDYQVDVL